MTASTPETPRSATPRGVLARSALLALAGCAASAGARAAHAPVQAPAAIAAERGWNATGEICVRLSRLESEPELALRGVRGRAGLLRVARSGGALALDGVPLAAAERELWLEPADPRAGIRAGERTYPGRLRVRLAADGAGSRLGLAVDNVVELETYVAGVVASEVRVYGSKPAELEAQAIASRSFALAQLAARGSRSLEVRLTDSTRDQAYAGRFEPGADARARAAQDDLALAIERTRGLVLTDGGRVLDARFHAACGGRTIGAAEVFPEAARFRSLASVDCPGCVGAPPAEPSGAVPAAFQELSWRAALEKPQLDQLALTFSLGSELLALEATRRDPSGRWLEVELTGSAEKRRLSFEVVRKEIQDGRIASNFVLTCSARERGSLAGGLILSGRGRGHGVGLCQNGCRELARRGSSAREILAHFYPGSALADGR